MFEHITDFIQKTYKSKDSISLHEPRFLGNEKKYVNECIDSTFVSSVGRYVDIFEKEIAKYTGAKHAIATSNGTSGLHISLMLAGVGRNNEVITQSMTFVATCNAINYCGAEPIFIDVDKETLGLSPNALKKFLKENTSMKNKKCINNLSGKVINACVPMHTFGHPCRIDEIKEICDENNILVIEDAAESVGSKYKNKHTGTFGHLGVMSFNGNKIITSGGGGCILTDNERFAKKAKHLSTTAKIPHKWDFIHDMVGYNYRMPNINAALLVAQLENLDKFIINKRELAERYEKFLKNDECIFFKEPADCMSNYWLNTIIVKNRKQRDQFLEETNSIGIMTRPTWIMMHKLPMFEHAQYGDLKNSIWLNDRIVNIPSSVLL
mgnify:CR=1 FL=1|tara:strand:+ start:10142 stop:11281 length:1140 start_codon:yes stop_codon:yes gene_type:complete